MNEPTHGEYDIKEVEGINKLVNRMKQAESIRDWSFILNDYIAFGNRKVGNMVAIFNMNSATDCPNADTENCQVPWEDCYAHVSENIYPQTLAYRRRQSFLWDCLDADTFAKAFLELISRKRKDVIALRFSQSGDFRHRGDIIKADRIAEILDNELDGFITYTYSASDYLNWSYAENFTVNQSNNFSDYGDRLYSAVPEPEDIPDNAVWCPHDREKTKKGVTSEEAIKCGECRLCLVPEGPDVYITLH